MDSVKKKLGVNPAKLEMDENNGIITTYFKCSKLLLKFLWEFQDF